MSKTIGKVRNEKKLEREAVEVLKMVGTKYAAPEVIAKMSGQIAASHIPEQDHELFSESSEAIKGEISYGERKGLEYLATAILKADENKSRQAEKERTREEWEALESEFVPPIPDIVPEGHGICATWNCNEVFKKRGRKKYCCPKCQQEQADADKRFKKTGTYLAPYRDEIREKREETPERMRKRKEVHLTDKMANVIHDYPRIKVKPKYIYNDKLLGKKSV